MSESNNSQRSAKSPAILSLPVLWADQDAFGHVNNTIPLRWFESGRFAYMEQSGLQRLMMDEGLGPILASIRCDYRRQVHYPDTIRIATQITRLGSSSMTIEQTAFSKIQQAVAVEGESVVVAFDYTANQPRRMSSDLRAAIESFEDKPKSELSR